MQEILQHYFEGNAIKAYEYFGAHKNKKEVVFTVYAPNALQVGVVGDFNAWQPSIMHKIDERGVYQISLANVSNNDKYKYWFETRDHEIIYKADPFAIYSEIRPNTASRVVLDKKFAWSDKTYLRKRTLNFDKAMNIYEMHLGSWLRKSDVERTEDADNPNVEEVFYNYEELIDKVIPYCLEMGYTHIELMPLNEHPFDGSWGYQQTGYFSATSRYGTREQLKKFINAAHNANLGVVMDFVLVHFVKDAHGLGMFDGGFVYEYSDEENRCSEWGTYNFNLYSESVRSFLMSAATYWLDEFHIDGLRLDAVSNLIYWGGNKERGENTGAIDFIKRFNYLIHEAYPSAMLIAEDSSDFQNVTKSTLDGGLGFDYKWDLGWMNDTLKYYKMDPLYRKNMHHQLTFSFVYFYNERFILPFSHDEVVHGKKTIVDKMWGDYNQKFAQARNLYMYMMSHPGKKLNFMGNELGMLMEWCEKKSCDWDLLKYPKHDGFKRYIRDLNVIYKTYKAFYEREYEYDNFEWIDADNVNQSVYVYCRKAAKENFIIVLNMTPVAFEEYRVGANIKGEYIELINSEKDIYDGCNMCNYTSIETQAIAMHGREQSLQIRLAPFSAICFMLKEDK